MEHITILAALLAAFVLVVLAGLHVYWGLGGRWPASDEQSLVELVVGDTPQMRMPGPLACLVVAGCLVSAALAGMGAAGLIPIPFATALALAAAGVMGLRGVGGFFEARFRPQIAHRPYARWNVRLYSPLCLALAGLLVLAAV